MILTVANIWVGFLAVILCAYYIKRDADSINAGMNSDASIWGKMKGWEWMVLLILFWILLPLYSWKREQIYDENLGYGSNYYIPQPSGLPLGKIVVGIFVVFFILFSLVFAAGMAGSASHSSAGNAVTVQSNQQATVIQTSAPVPEPAVIQKQDSITMGERNAAKKAKTYLSVMHFSRTGLIKQLEGFEKFSNSEAVYGVDNSGADWNIQAAGKAKDYIDIMAYSRDGLLKQLVEFEGFTQQQAEYGVNAVGY